jgi:hypothetical protein
MHDAMLLKSRVNELEMVLDANKMLKCSNSLNSCFISYNFLSKIRNSLKSTNEV